jgi:flagellar hook-length control protein FliK
VQAAASQAATPVTQPVTQTAAADAALTAAVAATAPVAPKATLLKTPATGPAKTAAGATDANPGKSDPSASAKPAEAATGNATQQPAAAGKQAGNNVAGDGTAGASSATSPATTTAHDHSPVAGAGHAPADPSDTSVQTTGAVPPQLPSAPVAAVAPLSVTVATNAPVPLSGLAIEIVASVKSGKSSFEIRLDPADLGRIDVRIDVDRNGQVTSHLTVEKPETLSMLRQDAPQLQQALDDAGFKTADGGLQFSLRDQSSSGQNSGNETSRNAQRLVISDEDTIPAAVAGRTYGRTLGSSSGVDIRV